MNILPHYKLKAIYPAHALGKLTKCQKEIASRIFETGARARYTERLAGRAAFENVDWTQSLQVFVSDLRDVAEVRLSFRRQSGNVLDFDDTPALFLLRDAGLVRRRHIFRPARAEAIMQDVAGEWLDLGISREIKKILPPRERGCTNA